MTDTRHDVRIDRDLGAWHDAVELARLGRAETGLRLIALAPADVQAEALRLLLELESVAVELARTLDAVWLGSTRLAYLDGRSREAKEALAAVSGNAEQPVAAPERTH